MSDEATLDVDLPPLPDFPAHFGYFLDVPEDGLAVQEFARSYAIQAVLLERERLARFVEEEYERQWVRPWRADLAAAIRGKKE